VLIPTPSHAISRGQQHVKLDLVTQRDAVVPDRRDLGLQRLPALVDRARAARQPVIIHTTRWMRTAQRMYERFGFERCPPFADYVEDPNSVFMTRAL